jgi:tRNA 2-thiouridine synthesizing protein A
MAMKKLDVRGAKSPVPIAKAKKLIDAMAPGDFLEVTASDPGSIPDFQGWVKTNPTALLRDQRSTKDETGRDVFVHVLERKA